MTAEQVIEAFHQLPLTDRYRVVVAVRPYVKPLEGTADSVDPSESLVEELPEGFMSAEEYQAELQRRLKDRREGKSVTITTEELFRRLEERRQ